MRVGIDTRFYSLEPTGIGRYTYELCLRLKNYSKLELVLFLNKNSPMLNDINFEHCEKVIIKEKKLSFIELFSLDRHIDEANLDIFHTPSFIIPFFKTVKTVVTIHDLIHIKCKDDFGLLHSLYYNFFVKRGCLSADHIITVSENSKKDLVNWLKKDNISVIYNAVSDIFKPKVGITELFHQFEIDHRKFILYTGNNRPNKNLYRLLQAYQLAKDEDENFPDLVLTCKPDNQMKTFIEDHILTDSVKFIGNVSDDELLMLYSYCLFFVFPSYYEGFGIPVLEAMSCGCSVAVADSSSIPEVSGEAGLYFDPFDINDIKKALQMLCYNLDLRKELRERSLSRSKRFSWDKATEETYKIYKSLME
jgi:glycosyltransferase involved in cell wall biosynthesis